MTWNPIDTPQDYILLAGQKSPGIAEVSGASSIREWDVRKGYGIAGAYSVFKSLDLSRFSVTLRLYSRQDWADWGVWKKIVDKLPKRRTGNGADSGCLDITHPLLEDVGIHAVGVAERLQPVQTGDGEWSIEIRFIEFRRPKLAIAAPDAAQAEPHDPVDDKIQALLDQASKLAAE